MSVNIFDPLNVIINNDENNDDHNYIPNKVPRAEKMMPFVNLKAYRKSRSNIIFNAKGFVDINTTEDLNINMMGFDPNKNEYTTNWSNNTIISDDNYDGFGITNIDITTNSSYIPEVIIEFVDVRGMNFLNKGKDSPYSVIYDFPPPIFELTIKGYYGKPLKYTLHLTKQNTKFDSETGNYHITVNLISNVFAPLTDVLFKYAEIIALMHNEGEQNIELNSQNEPKSIYELTYKLKNLYENIESDIKSSNEVNKFQNNKNKISKHLKYIDILNKKLFVDEEKYRDNVNFYLGINNGDGYKYRKIDKVNVFSNYCKTENSSVDARLVVINENTNLNINREIREKIEGNNDRVGFEDIYFTTINSINIQNLERYNLVFNNALDITKAYKKVHDDYYRLLDQQRNLQEEINEKIENKVEQNLGFRPTVRNIIKIICDDVDKMFEVLNSVKIKAEQHHEENFDNIIGKQNSYKDLRNTNKINAFPLFVEEEKIDGKCNKTETRVYPKNSIFAEYPFPETQFINDFINVFLQIRREEIPINIRMYENEDGNNIWIPITPLDSNINNEYQTYESPYFNYINKGDNNVNNIINILMERFLILSQFSFYHSFYVETDKNLIKLYSESEALNLTNSLTELKVIDKLKDLSRSEFTELLENANANINNTKEVITNSNRKFVIDKNNDDYEGILILNNDQINEKNTFDDSPIDDFIENKKPNWFQKTIFKEKEPRYSTNNILIIPDEAYEQSQYNTMYAKWYKNSYLQGKVELSSTSKLKYIIDSVNTNQEILNSGLSDSLLLLSLSSAFGRIEDISVEDFKSAIYDVPYFFILFVGGVFYNDYEDIKNNAHIIFNNGSNNEYSDKVIEIIDNLLNYFSDNDIEKFKLEFENVLSNTQIIDFLRDLNNLNNDEVEEILDDPDNIYNNNIVDVITERKYLVINSEYSWSDKNIEEYQTYSELTNDSSKNNVVVSYFDNFFRKLKKELRTKKTEFEDEEEEFYESIDDDDIKTQTYYSIKNVVDKWIKGYSDDIGYPFIGENEKLIDKFVFVDRAMNDIGDACIINAESIINMESNIEINVFTAISRLLSQNNFEFFPLQNFMNFEGDQWEESFKIYDSINSNVTSTPAFVCMYIGGTSSTLNVNNDYIDDGLGNLESSSDFTNNCTEEYYDQLRDDEVINKNVNYGEVNAFVVNYGIQNQSIFENIEIDSEEYPETNESLAILSKLAQDESNSTPISKGQNLYNLYENRAYSAKITMLGNAMLQPTNYFELKNIPLFAGSYVILNVEHNITPNHMKTTFNGVRILRYPNPLVTNFAESIGMLMGINSDINDEILNEETNDMDDEMDSYDAEFLPDEAKYNPMHPNNDDTLKI